MRRTVPLEVAVVWALLAAVGVEVLVTYARLPAGELYNVSGSGLDGGAGRALVFVNFPVALVAIALLVLALPGLRGSAARAAALGGVVLSAAVFWPGMVKQSDLDARPVNAIAAVGVLVALLVTFAGVRGVVLRPLGRADVLRGAVAIVALLLALPWMAADLGFSFDGVPVLGTLYQTGELRSQPGVAGFHPAVHHGHHHGMDGTLLVLCALLLSRVLPARGRLRGLVGAYLALMFCYGAGNVANDFWLEQVVKRGWTTWQVPDVTTPKLSVAWVVIVFAAGLLWEIAAWREQAPVWRSVRPD